MPAPLAKCSATVTATSTSSVNTITVGNGSLQLDDIKICCSCKGAHLRWRPVTPCACMYTSQHWFGWMFGDGPSGPPSTHTAPMLVADVFQAHQPQPPFEVQFSADLCSTQAVSQASEGVACDNSNSSGRSSSSEGAMRSGGLDVVMFVACVCVRPALQRLVVHCTVFSLQKDANRSIRNLKEFWYLNNVQTEPQSSILKKKFGSFSTKFQAGKQAGNAQRAIKKVKSCCNGKDFKKKNLVARAGFDPATSGLWAQHSSPELPCWKCMVGGWAMSVHWTQWSKVVHHHLIIMYIICVNMSAFLPKKQLTLSDSFCWFFLYLSFLFFFFPCVFARTHVSIVYASQFYFYFVC